MRPIAIGFVAGAALAGLGLFFSPASSTESTTTTTHAQVAAPASASGPWWFSSSETRIGPTAILLEKIDLEEGQVVVRYELRDIAPTALGRVLEADEINPFFATPQDDAIATPERWVLETADGEIEGASGTTKARAARFDVPDDFVLGSITGLRVESYRMRMPYLYEIEAVPVAGTEVILDEGFSFSIRAILPQADSVIFHVDYRTPSDAFAGGEPTPAIIRGVGAEWESYSQRQFEGLQLTLGTTELPDPFLLEVRTTYWVPFEASISFDLGGAVG